MGKTQLPPGLRFHPTDEELIKYYLKRKVLGKKLLFEGIVEVDIYKYAPWDLPDKSGWRSGDLKWYFFCSRAKKYASGSRMNRSTALGFWKTTGKDRSVSYKNEVVGMKKTLVFHRGKAPKGDRTDWLMHEYRLEEKGLAERGVSQDAYVLCSIFKKDGLGPRNGAQYGAPFCEGDWDDDNKDNGEEGNGVQALPSIKMSVPLFGISNAQNILMPSSSIGSEINVEGSLVSCPSATLPSTGLPSAGLPSAGLPSVGLPSAGLPSVGLPSAPEFPTVGSSDCISPLEILPDDIDSILNMFSEEGVALPNENDKSAVVDNANIDGPDPCAFGMSIYDDLGDLGSLGGFGEPGHSMSACCNSIYPKDPMFQGDDAQFMELIDLDVPLDQSTEPQGYSYVQSGSLYASNNFGDSSAHMCYSTSSGVVVECSLSSQWPEGSCSLNYQPHVSSEETATGTIPNQGYDIYQAGSSTRNTTFFDGAHMQVTESEQSERRVSSIVQCGTGSTGF